MWPFDRDSPPVSPTRHRTRHHSYHGQSPRPLSPQISQPFNPQLSPQLNALYNQQQQLSQRYASSPFGVQQSPNPGVFYPSWYNPQPTTNLLNPIRTRSSSKSRRSNEKSSKSKTSKSKSKKSTKSKSKSKKLPPAIKVRSRRLRQVSSYIRKSGLNPVAKRSPQMPRVRGQKPGGRRLAPGASTFSHL